MRAQRAPMCCAAGAALRDCCVLCKCPLRKFKQHVQCKGCRRFQACSCRADVRTTRVFGVFRSQTVRPLFIDEMSKVGRNKSGKQWHVMCRRIRRICIGLIRSCSHHAGRTFYVITFVV